ncbi:DUF5719 family protein [Trueperella pecoris]|uniref:Uncharacterized protein n=1 Tax=Trueperella pecoris TaxID=2733571 RepID=A0A7M1QVK9_9ACTO|nr:DUF5719 family protein [Trueperella pecoris]QOQ38327.1 hypothetical protein HLG82_01940 [Trueperella pecoris]QOR45187.1 hypothetical protein INS88_07845 [Trueperella pecoris]QTG75092.1 hypothetical protein J4179_07660 [Trueperella pecoris]
MRAKSLLAALTGVVVLGAAAGAGAATYLTDRELPAKDAAFAPAYQGQTGPVRSSLLCFAYPTIPNPTAGIDAVHVEEEKSSWAGVFADAEAHLISPTGAKAAFTGAAPDAFIVDSPMSAKHVAGQVDSPADAVVAGASIQNAKAGDSRGLAAATCQWPSNSVWLVGGASKVGNWLSLMMENASPTPTTVNIDVYSSRGKLEVTRPAITLEANATFSGDLTGIIAEDERIAIRLSSDTGAFVGALQVAALDGVKPAGIDILSDASVGTRTVIPGLIIPDDRSTSATVRVVNPHASPAQVNIATISADGLTPLPGGQGVTVAPQAVLDLSLDGLAPGSYGVQVSADQEIASAVALTRTDTDGVDKAWLAGKKQVTKGGLAIGPYAAQLVLTGNARATWTAYDAAGAQLSSESVTVKEIATVDVPAEAHFLTLEAEEPVYGAAMLTSDSGIAWVALTQDSTSNQSVKLTSRN